MEFRVSVVLPASGNGERFGAFPPKQFTSILGQPVILHTICNFHRGVELLCPTCPTRDFCNRTKNRSGVVIIQDGVRMFADEEFIKQIALTAKEHGAAGVTRSLVSTVISGDSENFLTESLNRSQYKASEMPQGFMYDVINTAYEKATEHDFDHGTECLLLAMKYADSRAKLIEGPDNLWKVTYRKDLFAAEVLLKESHIRARILPEKCCGSRFTGVCDKIKILCKERRLSVETEDEERFTPMCNSYVFMTDKLNKDVVYDNTDRVHLCIRKGTGIQIPPCVVHVFISEDIDVQKLSYVYDHLCKTYEMGTHYGIVFKTGADVNKLAEMVVDLLWNRTQSLSGQIFTLR